jgi:hypothetical protein
MTRACLRGEPARAVVGAVVLVLIECAAPATAAHPAATASVCAEVVAQVEVLADVATAVLLGNSPGTLTLSIPGGVTDAGRATIELASTGITTSGGALLFTAEDAAALGSLVEHLAASGRSITTSGFIGGKSVQVVVMAAIEGGLLRAIVTYN